MEGKNKKNLRTRTILFICLAFVFVSVLILTIYIKTPTSETETNKVYQGAVPEGYSLEAFRKTGQLIKEDSFCDEIFNNICFDKSSVYYGRNIFNGIYNPQEFTKAMFLKRYFS